MRDPQRATGTCIVLVSPGGERTMLPDPGANDALAVGDLPPLRRRRPARLRLLAHAPGLAGRGAGGDRPRARSGHEDQRRSGVAPRRSPTTRCSCSGSRPIDLLLPNADEAAVLGPQIDVPELVVKFGADGARWTNGVDTVTGRAVAGRRGRRHHRRRRRVRRRASSASGRPGRPATRSRPARSCAAQAVTRVGSRAS